MDKIKKHLAKLPRRKRDRVEQALCDIYLRRMAGYAMKKIRGHQFLYRIRIEDQRIIFYMDHEHTNIISVDKRDDRTYQNL